jgi:hypothetical protein
MLEDSLLAKVLLTIYYNYDKISLRSLKLKVDALLGSVVNSQTISLCTFAFILHFCRLYATSVWTRDSVLD